MTADEQGPFAERHAFLFLSALLAAPLLWVRHPPMTDLPSHAALISTLVHWGDGPFELGRLFELQLATPYLFGYGLVWVLAQGMPVVWAVKIVIVLGLVALPVSARFLLRQVDLAPHWAWLVFPTCFGYSFHWGFLNFVVASPLVLVFVALFLRFIRRPSPARGALASLFLLILVACHVIVAGLAGLLCLGLIPRHARSTRAVALYLLVFVPGALFALAWLALFLGGGEHLESWVPIAATLPRRLLHLPGALLGYGGDLLYSLAGVALVALPFVLGLRPGRRLDRWWPFGVCLALYLLWPEMLFGTSQVGQRFAVFLLPLLLFACRDDSTRPGARLLTGCASAALLLATWPTFLGWQQETRPFHRLVDEMEPGQRVLSLVFLPSSAYSPAPVYLHYPSWYAVEKGGVVEFSLAMFEHLPVRYRPGLAPPLHLNFAWTPQAFRWHEQGGERWDEFIVRAPDDVSPVLFPEGAVELVDRRGLWWRYRRVEGASLDAAARKGPLGDILEEAAVGEVENVVTP